MPPRSQTEKPWDAYGITAGTRQQLNPALAFNGSATGYYVAVPGPDADFKALSLGFSAEYAAAKNIWIVPSYELGITERHDIDYLIVGTETGNKFGLLLRTVF